MREDFEGRLDESPRDWELRAVYADWLEEHGEEAACRCQRWLAKNELAPGHRADSPFWNWTARNFPREVVFEGSGRVDIPLPVLRLLSCPTLVDTTPVCRAVYATRRLAEEDLAQALSAWREREEFERRLNEQPLDWHLRRSYAAKLDALGDHGYARAQAWMAHMRKSPLVDSHDARWRVKRTSVPDHTADMLDGSLFQLLPTTGDSNSFPTHTYPSRVLAEHALLQALQLATDDPRLHHALSDSTRQRGMSPGD